MATTKDQIRKWLNDPVAEGKTHMLVVCDTFEWEDYPRWVRKTPDEVRALVKFIDEAGDMQKVIEVYNYGMDLEAQINEEALVFNYDITSPGDDNSGAPEGGT